MSGRDIFFGNPYEDYSSNLQNNILNDSKDGVGTCFYFFYKNNNEQYPCFY